jgi:hypothetical protein
MKVTREDFDWAANEGLLTAEQSGALWEALARSTASASRASRTASSPPPCANCCHSPAGKKQYRER